MIHCCAIYIHVVDTLQYNSAFKAPGCAKHPPSLIWECIALEEKTKKHVHFNSDAFPRGKMPRLNWSLHMFAIQQPSRELKWIDVKRNKFFKKSLAPLLMLENSTDPSNLREITLTGETHTHTHTHITDSEVSGHSIIFERSRKYCKPPVQSETRAEASEFKTVSLPFVC